MRFTITGKPVFSFTLSPGQLQVLVKASELHYDFECVRASRVGGFIYGWKNFPELPCQASWRELDLCLKILEVTAHFSGDDRLVAWDLSTRFLKALKEADRLATSWEIEV